MPKFVQGYRPNNSDMVYPTYDEALEAETRELIENGTIEPNQQVVVNERFQYYYYPLKTLLRPTAK